MKMDNNNTSRSEYVIKNTTVMITMQIVKNLLAFIGRTVFVKVLGSEYLGVNSLFTEILTMLSFAELGIGNAMVFSLYKPLAEKDNEKIKSLMKLYARCYWIIGIVIAVLGVCLVPFLKYMIGDVSYIKENITLLYLLFLLNSVLSYFFVYKKSLIIADQKNYIVEIYQEIFYAIQVILQSLFLIATKDFIVYLLIVILCTFLNNVSVARKADKMYPCLKEKDVKSLEIKDRRQIVTNVKALVVYKVGGIILESTDSIFISTIINVVTVGLYANYKMVINVFKTIGSKVMESVIASVGNLNAAADKEKKYDVFKEMFYVNIWFYGFTASGLCIFLTDFIDVWLGCEYVIVFDAVLAASVYYFVSNMHYPCFTYRTTAGLFVFGKYVPMIAAVANIILDIILGLNFGLPGILWASTIARVFSYELIDPMIIYKNVFEKNVIEYYVMYAVYICVVLLVGLLSYKLVALVHMGGFAGLLIKALLFSLVFNIMFLLITFKTREFTSLKSRIKLIISH